LAVTDEAASALADALRDRYRLARELGRGGTATVYLADDLRHDRSVALKILRPEIAAALGPERFLREIRPTAQLQHPHILTVLDSGEVAGRLWFTMAYVEGESLRSLLAHERIQEYRGGGDTEWRSRLQPCVKIMSASERRR
jgi:eukaryotic-like serine/threonine-protein kinase